MQTSPDIEAASWGKIRRRWTTMLAALLAINFSLVAVAFSSYQRSLAVTTTPAAIASVAQGNFRI